jgi:multicomponent Na+:H+ antiporter subunit E
MIPPILARTAILALLWWIITQGQVGAWLIGLPAVALAAMASVYFAGTALKRVSLLGLTGFVAFFLRESVRGGFDVARRTLAPRLRIQPGFKNHRLRLNDPSARILLTNCISLLPGTLTARLDGNQVEVHLLDTGVDPEPDLRRLERAIARLFGLSLEPSDV